MMEEEIQRARRRSAFWGAVGGLALLGVYFAIVSVANSFAHALDEFIQLWYWIAALTVGFGVQIRKSRETGSGWMWKARIALPEMR